MPRHTARWSSRLLAIGLSGVLACVLACSPLDAHAQEAQAPRAVDTQPDPLTRALHEVDRERGEQSTLVPWLVFGAGLAAMVTGTALGVGRVLGCDRSCPNDFWPGVLVVGGSTLTTGGFVWLRLAQEDIAELESRRYHLQRQLDASHSQTARAGEVSAGPTLRLRLAF